ncbi:MAG TPA: LysM domain-containing protein [Mycobacteriales bacterium]|nr:LysM domain-containing protein [Mycobacteriales bacterium]
MESLDAVLAPATMWAAAGLGTYLAVGFTAALVAHQRGPHRRWPDRLLLLYPRLARAALRAFAVAVLGAGVAAPATSALAATPADGGPPRPPLVAPARPAAEPLDWPSVSAAAAPVQPSRPHRSASSYVTVRPGDCLWSLAARSLGRDATASTIAATWPRWWAANRDVLGADPALLQPGQRLRVPPAKERSAS